MTKTTKKPRPVPRRDDVSVPRLSPSSVTGALAITLPRSWLLTSILRSRPDVAVAAFNWVWGESDTDGRRMRFRSWLPLLTAKTAWYMLGELALVDLYRADAVASFLCRLAGAVKVVDPFVCSVLGRPDVEDNGLVVTGVDFSNTELAALGMLNRLYDTGLSTDDAEVVDYATYAVQSLLLPDTSTLSSVVGSSVIPRPAVEWPWWSFLVVPDAMIWVADRVSRINGGDPLLLQHAANFIPYLSIPSDRVVQEAPSGARPWASGRVQELYQSLAYGESSAKQVLSVWRDSVPLLRQEISAWVRSLTGEETSLA